VRVPEDVGPAAKERVRQELGLKDDAVVLYPGDYEISRGAQTVASSVRRLRSRIRGVSVVFACRPKTPRAQDVERSLRRALEQTGLTECTRLVGEVSNMHALLALAKVVVFPVDDLYGKVDIPLVLLEALALGVPLVLARGGPLETVDSASFVEPNDPDALAEATTALLLSPEARAQQHVEGRRLYSRRFTPEVVASAHDKLYEELMTRRGEA
jgi:phosphatidylinositol alpha-1,6-mannosyltransferase